MNITNFAANAYKKISEENNGDSQTQTAAQQLLNKQIKQEEKKGQTAAKPFERVNRLLDLNSAVKEKALNDGGLLKVPVQPSEKDSVYRRVAKFLMLIGVDEAAKILPHLTSEQTEKIIPEFATIHSIDPSEAEVILQEFKSLTARAREDGGVNTARNILEKAFGPQKAGELLDKAVPFKNGRPFEYLSEAAPEKIEALLKDESAPVRALVCSNLPPKKAAAFIQQLPETEKKEVILRLAKLKDMSPEIVAKIDEAMEKKLNSIVTSKSDSIDGKNILAHILKQMDSKEEEKILNRLSASDPDLGADLRERLFTVEDIINADDRFIQEKLASMEDAEIAFLIHAKTDDFREKILKNVSSNRRAMILDEEDRRIPMRRADVEKAAGLFFSALRRAWEEGKLIVKGRDDEIYV